MTNENDIIKIGDLVYYDLDPFDLQGLGIVVKISSRISGFGKGKKKKFNYHLIVSSSSLYIFDRDQVKKVSKEFLA